MSVIYGGSGIFGIVEHLPLRGFIEGEKKVIMSSDDFVQVHIQTQFGIRKFYAKEVEGFFEPHSEVGQRKESVTA